MIKVKRISKPAILETKEVIWLTALRGASTDIEKKQASEKYRHPQIQQTLDTMFSGKCGYCESYIKHISDAHIEHYKPKSRFPELTFDWDNLLLACSKCNSTFKSDKFPEAHENGPIINPCVDDPIKHFEFFYDAKAKMATVITMPNSRGNTTENLLGLNRKELREHRSLYITRILAIARLAVTDAEAQLLLDEAKQDKAEYAAFVRALV